jgi:CheY-like chemotaxis protein
MDRKRVLLVDDVELFLHLGKTVLQRKDLDVQTAASGNEALEKAREMNPDIIFLDLYMPDLNGDEVCRRLKADNRTSNIPIVILTSEGDEEVRSLCFSAGCDDYVTKPIHPEVLQATIERHLHERLRRHRRARVSLPCIILREKERKDGTMLSLSPYGAFVQMSHPPLPGKIHSINFLIPGMNQEMLLDALPIWNRRISADSPEGSGFEFQGVAETQFDRISKYVTETEKEKTE